MKKLLIAMAMMSAMAMAQTSASTDQSTSNSSSTPQASSTQSSTSTDTSAQSSDTSATHKDHAKTSSDSSALPQSDKDKSDKAAGKEKSVTGCLHKDGDNFWLKTRSGKYHVMSSQDLSAHDGHEVKITGTASKAPMPGSSDKKNIKHLEASNVEMVADQCKMGTKTMKMKGDQLEKEQPKK
jgi:hypothetical protein